MKIDLNSVKLPKKINPCPILESIVEFRFESKIPHDAIFGIMYNQFRDEYSKLQYLPILQLPEVVRNQDPSLKYKPYYKLSSEDNKFLFQIGARVFSLINTKPYDGWTIFSKKLKKLIQQVEGLSIIDSYKRIGIRYINGFDFNIFDKINLSINLDKNKLTDLNSTLRMEVPSDQFISTLQIINNAQIKKIKMADQDSIIDIDTHIEDPGSDIISIVERGHLEEKKLFFTLLKQDFINKELNPEY
ncbi:MAG: TIGR04255 family protein [Candidatus Humimicrobiaceae bacterium]